MKNSTFLLLIILIFSSHSFAQQQLLIRSNVITGQGVQAGKIRTAFGIGLQYQHEIKNSPFEYIITGETHLNGSKTLPYNLDFDNSITHINVKYYNTISKVTGGVNYVPFKKRQITPFISAQAGALWYLTTVQIDDAHDIDGCRPVQSKTVQSSFIVIGQVETGLRVYLQKKGKERSFLQAGAGFTAGSRGSYIQLMNDEHHPDQDNSSFNSKFQNNTGVVHEHSLGRIYRTTANQIFYSIGFGLTL